jgi:hypothetical protein
MSRHIAIAAICIFCCEIAGLLLWGGIARQRILILHSYDPGYAWTRGVDAGLEAGLGKRWNLSVRRHYLDTKRHPWPDFKETAGRSARTLIGTWHPDVIIAVDDDAQEYVARHYRDDPTTAVVFAGVNREAADYGYDHASRVTGILERVPLPAVQEGLEALTIAERPAPRRIFFIGDTSESVAGDARWIGDHDWSPLHLVGSRLVGDLPAWDAAVDAASACADLILVTNYRGVVRRPGCTDLVPPAEIIARSIQRSTIPVIGTNTFFIDDGGSLAIATSPGEQGRMAARLALDILDRGIAPNQLPLNHTQECVIAMDAARMHAAGLRLPLVYTAAARASGNYRSP